MAVQVPAPTMHHSSHPLKPVGSCPTDRALKARRRFRRQDVGRRDAYARISHVLCEVYVRLRAVGLANGQAFEMPITQAELGDATGMSTVHVNRTLQELRRDGLISTPK